MQKRFVARVRFNNQLTYYYAKTTNPYAILEKLFFEEAMQKQLDKICHKNTIRLCESQKNIAKVDYFINTNPHFITTEMASQVG